LDCRRSTLMTDLSGAIGGRTMRIYPAALEIGEEEGFSHEKDIFGRAKLGAGMTHLIGMVKDPMVIALDGQWGAGKSTFLKMWAGELRNAGHPVIYFDAFENDYIEDAFAAITRELVELIDRKTPDKSKEGRAFVEKAVEAGAVLVNSGAKLAAKIGVRAATAGLAKLDDFIEIKEDLTNEAGEIAEKYVKQLIESPKKQKNAIDEFKGALLELPDLLSINSTNDETKSLVFIIDELDRCKPKFALEIIERIKHFFSVNNVHFVFGVHLEQLNNSVKYAYGGSINSSLYLQKFINVTINLTASDERHGGNELSKYAKYLIEKLELEVDQYSHVRTSSEAIVRLVELEEMGLRTLERAFTILAISTAFTPRDRMREGNIMGGLIMMKLLRPQLFQKAKRGTLTLEEAREFLRFPSITGEYYGRTAEEDWWTFLLADEVPEELQYLGRGNYFIRDRKSVIKYTANDVIDRLSPND